MSIITRIVDTISRLGKSKIRPDMEATRYCSVCEAPLLNWEWDTFYGYPLCSIHIDTVRGAFTFTEAKIDTDYSVGDPPTEEDVALATIQCIRQDLQA